MKLTRYLGILSISLIVAGCAHTVDLRVVPVPADQNCKPVYIRSVTNGQLGHQMLTEYRTGGDVMREVLTDELHKKGYAVLPEPVPGCIELDVKLVTFGTQPEARYKEWNSLLVGIAAIGMSTLSTKSYVTAFVIEVFVSGPIFRNSNHGFIASKVIWLKRENFEGFGNRGFALFRAALSRKIPKSNAPSAGRTADVITGKDDPDLNIIERQAHKLAEHRQGAELGDMAHQLELSHMYRNGTTREIVLPKSKHWRRQWLTKSAQGGYAPAQYELYRFLHYEIVTVKSFIKKELFGYVQPSEEAMAWLFKAGAQGHPYALKVIRFEAKKHGYRSDAAAWLRKWEKGPSNRNDQNAPQ